MRQTAVDWLIEKLHSHSGHIDILDVASLNNYWKQAKEIEKEQIEEAFIKGEENIDQYGCYENPNLSEQYYKQTYEKDA